MPRPSGKIYRKVNNRRKDLEVSAAYIIFAVTVFCLIFWKQLLPYLQNYSSAVQAFTTIVLVGVTWFYASLTRRQLKFHEEKDKKDFAMSLILKSLETDYIDGLRHIQEGVTDYKKASNTLSFLELIGTAYFFEKVDRDIVYDFLKLDILKIYPKVKDVIERVRKTTGEKESFERFEFMAQDFQKRKELEDVLPLRKE